ncbi:MAG: FAD-dependent oxidoreductase [Kineosporiaceae bacterium]
MSTNRHLVRIVVVGFGMAGSRLVEDLLARASRDGAPALSITVVGAEPYPAYNRVLLSEVVAGRADIASLATADVPDLEARGVRVLTGVAAASLDRDRRLLACTDGTLLPYDHLVLATGARPTRPAVDGVPPLAALPGGVHELRTVDDARELVAAATNATRAVVVGGGLLGLEVARGLARRGPAVTVLHHGPSLLDRQLDATGGAVLARAFRRLGVDVRTGARTTAVRLGPTGRAHGVDVEVDGQAQTLDADLVVLSCGIRPDTDLAAAAGLPVGRGVLVDDLMRTADPAVSAIGDCAEFDGAVPGLVATAWAQARVVADLLTAADPGARYRHADPVVRLKAADVEVAAAGACRPDPWDETPGQEVVQLLDPVGGRYVKAVVREGRVAGAVVVGDARAAAELCRQVDAGALAPPDRTALLTPGRRAAGPAGGSDDPTLIPDRATVCRCNGVTKKALVQAWSDGARDVDALGRRTRAGTGCGTCKDALTGLLGWLQRSDPGTEAVPEPAGPAAAARDGVPGRRSAPLATDPTQPDPTPAGGTR